VNRQWVKSCIVEFLYYYIIFYFITNLLRWWLKPSFQWIYLTAVFFSKKNLKRCSLCSSIYWKKEKTDFLLNLKHEDLKNNQKYWCDSVKTNKNALNCKRNFSFIRDVINNNTFTKIKKKKFKLKFRLLWWVCLNLQLQKLWIFDNNGKKVRRFDLLQWIKVEKWNTKLLINNILNEKVQKKKIVLNISRVRFQ
jgi:hypothetical protein